MEAVYDVNTFLANDSSLQTLFGATVSNFPIYPLYEPPERPVPYVVYSARTNILDSYWSFRDTTIYVIYCDSIKKSGDIQNRMIQLIGLEKNHDEIPAVTSSSGYDFKRFKFIGSSLYAPKEEGGVHERHLVFQWDYTWTGVQ